MPKLQEIELKLLVPGLSPDEALQRLQRTPSLRRRKFSQTTLLNRYFDTPDHALRHERCALRVRQVGTGPEAIWVQTFKTAGTSQGGLSQRGEWEQSVPNFNLNADALAQTPWHAMDPDGSRFAALQPCFETTCLRTVWQVRQRNGTWIEVALDAGHVSANGQTQPLLELELELRRGPQEALFELANALRQHLPLQPSNISKAQRGYALAASR